MTSATKNKPIKLTVNIKEKEITPVKTMVKLEGAYQNDWSKKVEVDKMSNDYLNEKLYYFYNNGGPIMDI